MADRRPEEQEMSRAKKPKLGGDRELDPSTNPYLAHMYEEAPYDNGYFARNGNKNASSSKGLSQFKRHETTALQAHEAESGPENPFNGANLSQQYFNILKTRRDLPVHKQR
jgi:pre-mRNA-splicing factor ATP-dependent RNA helicase DHX15/PRP43